MDRCAVGETAHGAVEGLRLNCLTTSCMRRLGGPPGTLVPLHNTQPPRGETVK